MMMFPLRRSVLPGVAFAALLLASAPQAPAASPGLHAEEIVRFPSQDADLTNGAPTTLTGRFLRPAGTGPFPTVVLLHGCSGLYTKSGRVSARHLDWALTLRDQGYAVLMVDSFGPRGIDQVCTRNERSVRASVERKRDAWAALAYLQDRRRDVDNDRIAVMGWSQGAGTVLAAYGPGSKEDGKGSGFRAAVAFYPGCGKPLKDQSWQPEGRLLMLLGGKDEWTPAETCVELANREPVKERTEVVVYPEAHHGFDSPASPLRKRTNLATAPTGEATVGTNESARKDAIARVSAFLAQELKG
ncbi:dienelactone hydrolase family protein [Azospirillum soli]|uniref:dienelactone hydrolase family protein n=1 Tax=Azospirillum soli TaxID=1304799 RepID=UPI001AE20325|nr:dienelactone hydrolase family protein [Azospirillum soli]MBP2313322.1 dienelactone hydrolase [Azospirillum soli]